MQAFRLFWTSLKIIKNIFRSIIRFRNLPKDSSYRVRVQTTLIADILLYDEPLYLSTLIVIKLMIESGINGPKPVSL